MLTYPWRLGFGLARTALAVGALAAGLVFGGVISWPTPLLLALVAYALVVLRRVIVSDVSPRLTVAIDTVVFGVWIALASQAGYPSWWWAGLSALMLVFLLASAVVHHNAARVVGVVIAGFAVCLLHPLVAWPLACCGALAIVWSLDRGSLMRRLSRASRHSVLYRFEAQCSREDERRRIAADFHDGPLQSFIGMQLRIEIAKKLMARDVRLAAAELEELQELCRNQVTELRSYVRQMRPLEVVGGTLGASLSRMVEQFQKDTGVAATFASEGAAVDASSELSVELLQVTREALNNIRKHARARRVDVALRRDGDALEIAIADDGAGFPFAGSFSLDELDQLRMGPVSIRRRIHSLGGALTVDSRPGRGAALRVRVAAA